MSNVNTRRYVASRKTQVGAVKHYEPPAPREPTPTPSPTPTRPPAVPPPPPPAIPAIPSLATSGYPNGPHIVGIGGTPEVAGRYKTMGCNVSVKSGLGKGAQGYCIHGSFRDPDGREMSPSTSSDKCTDVKPGERNYHTYYLTAQALGIWTFVATITGAGGTVLDTSTFSIKAT